MAREQNRPSPFVDDIDKALDGLQLGTSPRVDRDVLKEIARERDGRHNTGSFKEMQLNIRVGAVTYDMLDALVIRLGVDGRRQAVEVAVRALMRSILRIEERDKAEQQGPAKAEASPQKWRIPTA